MRMLKISGRFPRLTIFTGKTKHFFMQRTIKILLLLIISGICIIPAHSQKPAKQLARAGKRLSAFPVTVDSMAIDHATGKLIIYLDNSLSKQTVREGMTEDISSSIREQLGRGFGDLELVLYSGGKEISEYVPNMYRQNIPADSSRIANNKDKPLFISRPGREAFEGGLEGNNIALWHSHGYYYEMKQDRWEWQRAKLHSTVEDIYPMGYVLPYLAPMLENAGATVLIPRERDLQLNEVIVDNDGSTGNSEIVYGWGDAQGTLTETKKPGFKWKDSLIANENPFKMGSHLGFQTDETASLTYVPHIPEQGEYAVYISYAANENNVSDALYTINYSGGKAEYRVNQQMGQGTWIYLGTYHFLRGTDMDIGSVRVSGGKEQGIITSDAIKFGGGMGNVARRPSRELMQNKKSLQGSNKSTKLVKADPERFSWKISGKPRYMEAARYWMQYSGMPDSTVYSLNEFNNDYNDDYQGRGEWVKHINRSIPVDLSLAFHTDAGTTDNDSIIGTLGICSTTGDEGIFSHGQSKMASRELTDIVMGQIVEDIRSSFNPKWTKREIWDKQYSEAYRPDVPAMLLELLSHQNLADMVYGLDPRFRFAVSRAIYKGILRFQAYQEGREPVVQPLPPNNLSIERLKGKKIKISWSAVRDPLEPTATSLSYRLYTRKGKKGFDMGRELQDTSITIELEQYGEIYSFKLTALNQGGESFPSEILSVGILDKNKKTALVVNAFDRVSGPAVVDGNKFSGIAYHSDMGVPYIRDMGHTGEVYDFNRNNPWLDDDNAGWGACYSNFEGKLVAGNTFDFPLIHGEAIMAAGMSFVSSSDEAFISSNNKKYSFIDIIFGEEKATEKYLEAGKYDFRLFTPEMMARLKEVTGKSIPIFISGAYTGSDHIISGDSIAMKFCEETLHYKWRSDHSVITGGFYSTDYAKPHFRGKWEFNTVYNPYIYRVESPDAIEPAGEGAICAFRYRENNASAGTFYNGGYKVLVLGFPFETIPHKDQRLGFMKQIINTLTENE